MKCRRTKNLLSAYLDEELDPRQRQAVDAHLPKCSACRKLLEELRSTVQLIGDLPKERAPEDLAVTIQEAAERAALLADTPEDDRDWKSDIPFADPSPRRQWPHAATLTRILTAAAAILAAVGFGIWIGQFAPRPGGGVDQSYSQHAAAPRSTDAPELERSDRSNKNALTRGRRKRVFAEAVEGKAAGVFGGADKKQADVLQRKAGVATADAPQYFFIDVADRETAVRMLRNLVVLADGRKDAVVLEAATYSGENLKEGRGKYGFATQRVEKGMTAKAEEADRVCVVNLSEHRVASFLKVLDETVGLRLARAEEKMSRSTPTGTSPVNDAVAKDADGDKSGDVAGGRLALAPPTPSPETAPPGSGIQSHAAKPKLRVDGSLADQLRQSGAPVTTPAPAPERQEQAPMPAAPAPVPPFAAAPGELPGERGRIGDVGSDELASRETQDATSRPAGEPARDPRCGVGRAMSLKTETRPTEAGAAADVSTAMADIVTARQRATTRPAAGEGKAQSTRPAEPDAHEGRPAKAVASLAKKQISARLKQAEGGERMVRLIFILRTPRSSE